MHLILVIQEAGNYPMMCASPTRGILAGGYRAPTVTDIDFNITIASTGNSTDFGDLLSVNQGGVGASNSQEEYLLVDIIHHGSG